MKKSGFSLLEILITLAIIGVLASLGFTSYKAYLARQQRMSAELKLEEIAQALEQYKATHDSYEGATLTNLQIAPLNNSRYKIIINMTSQHDFLIQAIPQQDDEDCGILTLDARGDKQISGAGNVIQCWF